MQKANDIIDRMDIKLNSKKAYKNRIERIVTEFGINIFGLEDEIYDKITSIRGLTLEQYRTFLSTIYVIRRGADLPCEILKEVKNDEESYEEFVKFKGNPKPVNMPKSRKEVLEYIDMLYDNKHWNLYIINYLVSKGVRNMDLDLIVTTESSMKDLSENYLIIQDKNVLYVRNSYKTVKVYGQKRDPIKDEKFIMACKQYLGDKKELPLLMVEGKDGPKRSEKNSIGGYIKDRLYNKHCEREIFSRFATDGDKYELRELSKFRGTDLSTINYLYDRSS